MSEQSQSPSLQTNPRQKKYRWLGAIVTLVVVICVWITTRATPGSPLSTATNPGSAASDSQSVEILVDDFNPQPYQGQSTYYYNRLDGDRGALNNSQVDWGKGQATVTVAPGASWGGIWLSLRHPIREGLAVNFSAVLPAPIMTAYQNRITHLRLAVVSATPKTAFRIELKNGDAILWKKENRLSGETQILEADLPALEDVNQLVLVIDQASPGTQVTLQHIAFRATTPIHDTSLNAFVWSYGMLLDNWDQQTGLVRDKAKDASGEMDAIQSTGSLAVATLEAEQLGVISHESAVQIVETIANTLLTRLPRYHGLLPHWVSAADGKTNILEDTEWSSVDTVIAAIGLLEAQAGLGLDTASTEDLLRGIDWVDLVLPTGISHGYTYTGERIPYTWDTFGGESWLVGLAYTAATGELPPLSHPNPPTANGSGFIDELAWLFLPPPERTDAWGVDWPAYRESAAAAQIQYYPTHYPQSCFSQLGLFGLSAGEQPDPARVPIANIYQAYGTGGQFGAAADGSSSQGAPVILPHYSAMIASLHPQEALKLWEWLVQYGHFSPMNNVESLMFAGTGDCASQPVVWNQLKGSWNLVLQALGWGSYLAQSAGKEPAAWSAMRQNSFLSHGYQALTDQPAAISLPQAPIPAGMQVIYTRECETPDGREGGQPIARSNASGLKVLGQFGAESSNPWPAAAGSVQYQNIDIPKTGAVSLLLRYSKHSSSTVPIEVYLDDEPDPRATLMVTDRGDWNQFGWTEPASIGELSQGMHRLKFSTAGQQYGVADLDLFALLQLKK